jgi:hypothetical protein
LACREGLDQISDRRREARDKLEAELRERRVWKSWRLGRRPLTEAEILQKLDNPGPYDEDAHKKIDRGPHRFIIEMHRAANMTADKYMTLTLEDAAALRTWLTDESRALVVTELGV